jgi:hypothetical protein
MSLRTGILSDKHFKKNCLDYQAPRVGVFNADFAGDTINPFLMESVRQNIKDLLQNHNH